jgi:uncharacterized protein (TIRG00374 family)
MIGLYLLAFAFLAIVVWRSEFWNAEDSLNDVSPAALVGVLLMCALPIIPLALRGRELLWALGYRLSAISLAPISYYANTASFLTPASSGELLRPTLLEQGFSVPAREGAGVVVYERLYSFFLLTLAGALAFTWTGVVPVPVAAVLIPAFAVVSMGPPLLFNASHERLPLDKPAKLLPGWIRRRIGSMEQTGTSMKRLLASRRLGFTFVVTSWVVFAITILQFWLLVEGLGEEITPAQAGVVLVFGSLAGLLSALPLGLGAMDVTMVALLRAYDVETDTALGVVVLTRCLVHLPAGILGLVAYLIVLRQRPPGAEPNGGRSDVSGLAPNTDARV